MPPRLLWLCLGLLAASGCVSPPVAKQLVSPAADFPADALITQRALFTVHGRQFPLNGYLALSAEGGKRLVVTENLGSVLADVLVKPDGQVFVMQTSRAFGAPEIRFGIASDLQAIFGGFPLRTATVNRVEPNHFVIDRSRYVLDLRVVSIKPGPQPPDLFDETKTSKQ